MEEVFFKQNHTKEIKLDIKKVILLDNCSTIYLFWNSELVKNITNNRKRITVQGKGGTLLITYKAMVPGYKQDVCLRKYYITNIIALKTLIKKYRVTYDSIDQIFVVHREDQ